MADRPTDRLLPVCGLWPKTSPRGTACLVGRVGDLKVLIVPNRDRQGDDDPTHVLLLTKAGQPAQARPASVAQTGADSPVAFSCAGQTTGRPARLPAAAGACTPWDAWADGAVAGRSDPLLSGPPVPRCMPWRLTGPVSSNAAIAHGGWGRADDGNRLFESAHAPPSPRSSTNPGSAVAGLRSRPRV